MKGVRKTKSNKLSLKNAIIYRNKNLSIKNIANLDLGKLRTSYLNNIRNFTFWGLYFPFITFLLTTLVIFWAVFINENTRNLVNHDQYIFLVFTFFISLAFTLGLAYKIFLKGQKCIYTKHKRSTRYIFISKKETQNFLKSLDAKIKSQYIYFAPIETNRLIIREFKLLDANDYYYVFKSKKVCKYLSFSRLKSKKEAVKAITKATNDYQNKLIFKLAIELKLEQKVIGYIGLSRYDLTEDTCQIVYAISEKYWRQGYTSEAVRVFVEYLKQNGKKLIIAGHVEENIHSGKVLLKNGFKRSPHLDHQMIIHRTPKNIKIYTIDERN